MRKVERGRVREWTKSSFLDWPSHTEEAKLFCGRCFWERLNLSSVNRRNCPNGGPLKKGEKNGRPIFFKVAAERRWERREAACLCTESGLRCRFLSGEANLWRLENNLVTAVGGCWGGGVGGGGRVSGVSRRWEHAWHFIPFQLMRHGLRAVNPPSSWEPESQGLVFLPWLNKGQVTSALLRYKDLRKGLKNTQAWTRSSFIMLGRRHLRVSVKINENKDIMQKTTF